MIIPNALIKVQRNDYTSTLLLSGACVRLYITSLASVKSCSTGVRLPSSSTISTRKTQLKKIIIVDSWSTINAIKKRRFRCIGHVLRMQESNNTKITLRWTPQETRPRGRPNTTWRKGKTR